MIRRPRPTVLAITVALSALGAGCSSDEAAPAPSITTPAAAPTTAAPTPSTTDAPATTVTPTTVAPTTTEVVVDTTESVPGRTTVFTMSDGERTFSITTDVTSATATLVVEPDDGSGAPRWETTVPWVDEVNVSGHRPFDGLPTEPVTGTSAAAANQALVTDYVQTALVEDRWEDVDRFFRNGEYVLHGPLFADGVESVRSFFVGLRDAGSSFVITETSVWLAAGDFVLAINRHDAPGAVTAYWDLWRVDDGVIVEHWDAIAAIPVDSADAWFAGEGAA